MSLDQNLFTLLLSPHKDDPNVVDLVDPSGTAHYRKRRLPGLDYRAEVYDPMSESLLATATALASTSKLKTLELCNPTMVVELKSVGTLSFRWAFKYEEHEFEWKREECFLIRKPDPPVLVAVTKEPPGRLKTMSVQILDYNLNRFDVNDRKGLEIVILTALLTFQDSNESHHSSETNTRPILGKVMGRSVTATTTVAPPAPPTPPKAEPKIGIDRIAEIQAAKGDYNEVIVEEEGRIDDYAQYCSNLLMDDGMLFVTVRSAASEQVPKVLQIVEQTKRIRHKAGLSEAQELHQYVLYDTLAPSSSKGPKRIVLDDAGQDKPKAKGKYVPPNSLTIHLSKIPMPELQPKANIADKQGGKKKGTASPPRASTPTTSITNGARPTSRDEAGPESNPNRPENVTKPSTSKPFNAKPPNARPNKLVRPSSYSPFIDTPNQSPPPPDPQHNHVRASSQPHTLPQDQYYQQSPPPVYFPAPSVPNLPAPNSGSSSGAFRYSGVVGNLHGGHAYQPPPPQHPSFQHRNTYTHATPPLPPTGPQPFLQPPQHGQAGPSQGGQSPVASPGMMSGLLDMLHRR